jgi:hypothetical protein
MKSRLTCAARPALPKRGAGPFRASTLAFQKQVSQVQCARSPPEAIDPLRQEIEPLWVGPGPFRMQIGQSNPYGPNTGSA